MNKTFKYTLIVLGVLLIAIQFFGPARPEVSKENPHDITLTEGIPDSIAKLLKGACYDCHSMETDLPFYARIAPVSWWIGNHVNHGREELNFSIWAPLGKREKIKLLKKIGDELEAGNMPLDSYKSMHKSAKLSEVQVEQLMTWSDELANKVFKGG